VFIVSRRRGPVKAFCKDFEQNLKIVKKIPQYARKLRFQSAKRVRFERGKMEGSGAGEAGGRPTGKRKMQKSTKNRCIDAENVVSYQEVGNLLPQGDSGKEVFLC
jgi:hypothetical protein